MFKRKLLTTEKGDTIIEVLIAIAVVSSVLGVAYGTMNRNLIIVRDNQERTEASKIAQGQIEALKVMSLSNPTAVDTNQPFCINSGAKIDLPSGIPSGDLATDNFSNYGACASGFFRYSIWRLPTDASGKTYVFTVRWDRFGGGRNQAGMMYKIE